jgi:uncharacterized damage-inducible protein DinB
MPTDPRYPIGPHVYAGPLTDAQRADAIGVLTALPDRLRAAVAGLDDAQLDTPYRDGGWTVRQVVHHVPDSHLNAYVRFRLALTEDAPMIRPYDEARWAELPDARTMPADVSLKLLDAVHTRWVALLNALGPDSFARTYVHPEHGRTFTLDEAVSLYAWHSRHHTAHVTALRDRMGW